MTSEAGKMAVGGGRPLAVVLALLLVAALSAGGTIPGPAAAPRESAAVSAAYAAGELLVTLKGEWEPALREVCRAAADGRRIIRDEAEELVARQAKLPAPFLVRLRLGEGWGMEQARRLLERMPAVESVEPNYLYRKSETVPDDSNYGQQWNLRRIGADLAWDVTQGSDSLTLAVIDTGLDYGAPEFAGRCVSGWDFINNDPDPYDDYGHGTGVASVAAATTNNANLIAGITWRGKIMPLKALDSHGVGKTDAWAVAEKVRASIRGMSIELGEGLRATVSSSIGVATFGERHHEALSLLAAADEALYRAKRAGRDRVELAAG